MSKCKIPIIDLFAGPGGLGEGFSAFSEQGGHHPFEIGLSIEKDIFAHRTLMLRAFVRWFVHQNQNIPQEYYDYLQSPAKGRDCLFKKYAAAAKAAEIEAQRITLGQTPAEDVDQKIATVLADQEKWVLIGGPPCQAYSLVGRSRILGRKTNKILEALNLTGLDESQLLWEREKAKAQALVDFSKDARHTLYREYLRIIAKHAPSAFVMENVRGIISAKVDDQFIFPQILKDLKHPCSVAHEYWPNELFFDNHYSLFSFVTGQQPDDTSPADYLIKSEDYGIPQARHRVILFGIRTDLIETQNLAAHSLRIPKKRKAQVTVRDVLERLPKLRSGVSDGLDSQEHWHSVLREVETGKWISEVEPDLSTYVISLLKDLSGMALSRECKINGDYLEKRSLRKWFNDSNMRCLPNHEARSHMPTDLHRYLFSAAFCALKGKSPKLGDFPESLLPKHKNIVIDDVKQTQFADRFRVQSWEHPSTTVTCHISKDGHYFIHPDPLQCRSLTVREAARLQTFPDNYFFEGPRTEQYKQVGNAVPPLLARKIAKIVFRALEKL